MKTTHLSYGDPDSKMKYGFTENYIDSARGGPQAPAAPQGRYEESTDLPTLSNGDPDSFMSYSIPAGSANVGAGKSRWNGEDAFENMPETPAERTMDAGVPEGLNLPDLARKQNASYGMSKQQLTTGLDQTPYEEAGSSLEFPTGRVPTQRIDA